MNQLVYFVQGSDPQPYRVAFTRYGRHLEVTCTCQAGQKRSNCKHRMDLIAGDITSLIVDSSSPVDLIPAMLVGSDVADAMTEIPPLERAAKVASDALHNPRAALGRVMNKNLAEMIGDGATPRTISFLIKGSERDPYTVSFSRHQDLLEASCTCKAGRLKRLPCKHRMSLITGNLSKINFVTGSEGDPKDVPPLVAGTDVAQRLAEFRAVEAISDAADEALSMAKNYLTWTMNKTDATLRRDLPGTGYKAGLRARIEREQTRQEVAPNWTTLADHAFFIAFSTGGSIWVKPGEIERDPPKPSIFG